MGSKEIIDRLTVEARYGAKHTGIGLKEVEVYFDGDGEHSGALYYKVSGQKLHLDRVQGNLTTSIMEIAADMVDDIYNLPPVERHYEL